jgi:phage tail sheath gpL-like
VSIQFANLPSTLRVPFVGVEFDPSRSRQGPAVKAYVALLVGHRTSAGTVAEKLLRRITGSDQAATWFGKGSMLHHMAEAWFRQNQLVETWAIAFDEEAGTAAVHRVAFAGPSTAAGTLYLWIGGRRVKTAVASGASASTIATNVAAAINADATLPVTASPSSANCDLTYRHKGTSGNALDVRVNFGLDEELPAGVTATITLQTTGATDPDLSELWPVIGEKQFDVFAIGFHDSTGRTALDTELEDRWGPQRQNDGTAFLAMDGTHSALTTLGATLNSKHLVLIGFDNAPTPPWDWSAALGSVAARELQADPARPLQTLELRGVLGPAEVDRFTFAEQNLALYDGISTWSVDSAGVVRLGRVVTTYQKNATGQDDTAFLDLTSTKTLSYLRYDLRSRFLLKYPRHKLANDGTNFGAGQPVMTPALARAECVAAFKDWETLGLVEGVDQFKADLVAERDPQDPNRLNILLSPDLVNQLVVVGARMAFLL